MRYSVIARVCFVSFLLTLPAVSASADPEPLTTCGRNAVDLVLTGDLDCSDSHGFAVTLLHGGTLDLNGYTLTGTRDYGQVPFPDLSGGVRCAGGCTISNGTIAAPAGLPDGAWQSHGVSGDEFRGRGRVVVSNLDVHGWTGTAVRGRRLSISDSTFEGNKIGVSSTRRVDMVGCSISGNWRGVQGGRRTRIFDSSITDSTEVGVWNSHRVDLTDAEVSDSGSAGVFVGKLRATGSNLVLNCQEDASPECADIVTVRPKRPRLATSACGTSVDYYSLETWGVCSLD